MDFRVAVKTELGRVNRFKNRLAMTEKIDFEINTSIYPHWVKKMRYIFDTPKMPEIGIIEKKKDRKSSKINQNVSHQYGKKNIF